MWDGTCCRRGRLGAGLLTCLCSERLPELASLPAGSHGRSSPHLSPDSNPPPGDGERQGKHLFWVNQWQTHFHNLNTSLKIIKNRHQKLGLTTIRYSCRLKEKRERHELMKPHDKSGSSRSVMRVQWAPTPGKGSGGHAGTSVHRVPCSHFLSEPRPSRAGQGPRALRESSPLSWEENKSQHV